MYKDIFAAEVLNLPENLQSEEAYGDALDKIGWKLKSWDENPLTEHHSHSPVRVKLETATGNEKDFLILRSGNSTTFAIIKEIDGEPHVLVRNEAKGTGIDIITMPSGYMNANDNSIKDTALRKLFEEAGMELEEYYAVDNSAAALSNNSTNTSTSFIAEISKDSATPDGWTYIPLASAAANINHLPSQQAAYAACAHQKIIPQHDFTKCDASNG